MKETINEASYLEERLQGQIDWHSTKSSANQRMYKGWQVIVIIAGALLPFAAGFQKEVPQLTWVVGGLGVLVAVVTGILGLYRFQELWVNYRATAEALLREKYLYLAQAPPYDAAEPFPVLVDRVETVLGDQNKSWQKMVAKSADSAKSGAAPGPGPAPGG